MPLTYFDQLACPVCKGSLIRPGRTREIVCPRCRLAFPVIHDVPVMIARKARNLTGEEVDELVRPAHPGEEAARALREAEERR